MVKATDIDYSVVIGGRVTQGQAGGEEPALLAGSGIQGGEAFGGRDEEQVISSDDLDLLRDVGVLVVKPGWAQLAWHFFGSA